MRKSVLIATGIFPPQIGGPATYSKLLRDVLPVRGFKVRVANFGDFLVFPKIIRHIIYFFHVLRLALGARIIYAQDPVSVGLPALLAAKVLGKKFILKVVGDYAWEQYSQGGSKPRQESLEDFQTGHFDWMTELRRKAQVYVAKKAKAVIVPSDYLRKIVSGWGVNPGKISLVYNAFNPPKIYVSKEEARRKLNLHGTIVISAGRLVPWKGFQAVIDSMPKMTEKVPDAKLYIIGEGPLIRQLADQISNLKLGDKVFLLGRLPQNILFQYLVAADVFVLNTNYEGFSHQILEAMALGAPVITTRKGGNPEIIGDGIEGILIDYNDKEGLIQLVETLHTNLNFREDIIQRAKIKAGTFSLERMISETVKILNAV